MKELYRISNKKHRERMQNMADIVASSKRKINLFDRVIQSVVIMVNMNKMNRAIDEHLSVLRRTEGEDKVLYQENILREIVFVKYQYDIMQREMYELKISYPNDIIQKVNSTDKIERLELQKTFLEMEYDRVTKSKFKSREDTKFNLLSISSAIDSVKQNIKDEGKAQRYNHVIKMCEDVDTRIQTDEYKEEMYKALFEAVDDYVGYINDNYDISKLPSDERELIEFVIETMIKGIESDIDKHMYEFNLMINICKNSYRYFKVIDKIFFKIQSIYDESLENGIVNLKDYIRMYKEIYDMKIKTKVNDVHRTIITEDEYLEYSKLVTNFETEKLDKFLLNRALEVTAFDKVKKIIMDKLEIEEVVEEPIILDEIVDESEERTKESVNKVKEIVKKVVKKIAKDPKIKKTTATKTKTKTKAASEKKKIARAVKPKKEKVVN
jgi:hypothetical protein